MTTCTVAGWLALALVASGCGGGKKGDTTPEVSGDGDDDGEGGGDGDDGGDTIVPPERMDEIKRTLDGRRRAAARCLSDAVNEGKASREARGHVALAFVIGRDGRARNVQVVRSSIKNPDVERCVVGLVEQADFGRLSIDLDWSYTYAFESM
ncbi:MAG: AgmX/PglI C-terminal domain-containing protein [Kofleriaceae bacterium]|nr:AgmX/PglI C-terminal domain-containing protein [Kofleriaceae bacterium]MCL4226033.1 AgmX/PglI C-terminal domain-containing protein [Myxococcales bacterium]